MARVELVVCDVCEDKDRGTRHYKVTSGARKAEADLCDEHALPLEHLLGDPRELDPAPAPAAKRVTTRKRASTARTRTSLGAKVTTLEAIESGKKGLASKP